MYSHSGIVPKEHAQCHLLFSEGAKRAVLVELNLLELAGLAVHGNYIYWIDKRARKVERIQKTDNGERGVVQGAIDDLSDLVVVDKRKKDGKALLLLLC